MFQINKYYGYQHKTVDIDDYRKTVVEAQKGMVLSLSKEVFDNVNFVATGKITDIEIIDSNLDYLIGKKQVYTPRREADLSCGILFKGYKVYW